MTTAYIISADVPQTMRERVSAARDEFFRTGTLPTQARLTVLEAMADIARTWATRGGYPHLARWKQELAVIVDLLADVRDHDGESTQVKATAARIALAGGSASAAKAVPVALLDEESVAARAQPVDTRPLSDINKARLALGLYFIRLQLQLDAPRPPE